MKQSGVSKKAHEKSNIGEEAIKHPRGKEELTRERETAVGAERKQKKKPKPRHRKAPKVEHAKTTAM